MPPRSAPFSPQGPGGVGQLAGAGARAAQERSGGGGGGEEEER